MISYDANFSKLKLNVGGNCDLNTVGVPSYSGGIPPNATNLNPQISDYCFVADGILGGPRYN